MQSQTARTYDSSIYCKVATLNILCRNDTPVDGRRPAFGIWIQRRGVSQALVVPAVGLAGVSQMRLQAQLLLGLFCSMENGHANQARLTEETYRRTWRARTSYSQSRAQRRSHEWMNRCRVQPMLRHHRMLLSIYSSGCLCCRHAARGAGTTYISPSMILSS